MANLALSVGIAAGVAFAFAYGIAQLPPEVESPTRWRDAAVRFSVLLLMLSIGLTLLN